MTSFIVSHGNLADANDLLGSAVQNMGTILDGLKVFLNNMNGATQGQAAPLWEAQQNKWTADYHMMVTNLNSGHTAAVNIGNTFLEGDRRGAQIMM